MMKAVTWCLVLIAAVGCTKRNPAYCESDLDCPLAAAPFCDVAGEFEESGFNDHACSERPVGCPLERCGCSPGEPLGCDAGRATVCNPDGLSASEVSCGLGCSSGNVCNSFEPSNGLASALASAHLETDVVFPTGTVIDSDVGSATAGGVAIPVMSFELPQAGVAAIRVFVARSFTIDGVTIRGQNPVALVAAGDVMLRGPLTARATAVTAGPGAQETPAACAGSGAGGAGNATSGGHGGGPFPGGGGASIPNFEPLVGGCRGGTVPLSGGVAVGGAGGGAIQIVANGVVSMTNTGLIDVGGGGGDDRAGGGSGGTVIIEAPRVMISGSASGVSGNGGGGGGCDMRGGDGAVTTTAAIGPKCSKSVFDPGSASAGNGGTVLVSPEIAETWTRCDPQLFCPLVGGGGGGSVGRARIATRSGDFEGTAFMSVAVSRAVLVPR